MQLTDSSGLTATTYTYDPMSRLSSIGTVGILPAASASYPLDYIYASYGRMTQLKTYRDAGLANPELGRWLSRDPIIELGGFNLFSMLNNNPLNYTDLLGLAGSCKYTPGSREEQRDLLMDESKKLSEKAVEQQPQNEHYAHTLGYILCKQGNYIEAVNHLEKALTLITPCDNLEIRHHLAESYFKIGESDKAKEQWTKALELNPDDKLKEQIQAKLDALEKEAPDPLN